MFLTFYHRESRRIPLWGQAARGIKCGTENYLDGFRQLRQRPTGIGLHRLFYRLAYSVGRCIFLAGDKPL